MAIDTEPVAAWPRLRPGDVVRIVSPASTPDATGVAAARAELESWGLRVQVGAHVFDEFGYMAGQDEDRLADLNEAFRDPAVRAIITSRGGAGAYRIADAIDFDAVSGDPKPVIGYSDITYLHLALWRECRLAGIHGAVAPGARASATLKQLLMTDTPVLARRDPQAYSAQITVHGHATGPLVGGNLSTLAHMVGAGLPSLAGAIVLLEDKRDMGLGRVDRQLTQLIRSGSLDDVAGIALGLFTGFDNFGDRGWTLADVLHDHLDSLGVPVLGGLNAGHHGADHEGRPDQVCLALGGTTTINTETGSLRSSL